MKAKKNEKEEILKYIRSILPVQQHVRLDEFVEPEGENTSPTVELN